MTNFRDIEQLSAYLDGQLSPSESARLESRISADPSLASAFNDIRAARGIIRKLPVRKAPRNFTLTRQMVGLKPPLPRSYSVFRFSTAFATFLLMLTFAANTILPRISFGAAAPAAQAPLGIGGGGGGGFGGGGGACEPPSCIPPALAPLATEAPAAAPAATEAPFAELAAPATESPAADSANSARAAETPTAEALPKEPATESALTNQSKVKSEAVVPLLWQVVLLMLGLVSGLIMFLLNRSAKQKWK